MHPAVLPRPLLVLSGWRAWPLLAWSLARSLRRRLGASADEVAWVSFATVSSFEAAVRRVVRRVEERWPGGEDGWTREVDVVGVSMGGITARAAAAGVFPGVTRLRIARLFTLATPHRGARLAKLIALDPAARDMRPGSPFLVRLDERLPDADYEMICYARLRDWWVGARNAAPPGEHPIWVRASPFTMSHLLITRDGRILDDVCRRLIGEEPSLGAPSEPPSY